MTRSMIGALYLLAASVSPVGTPAAAPPVPAANQRVSASARVSVTILTAVRFGPGQDTGAVGAHRRRAQLVEADGLARPAELLEFQ